MQTITRNIFVRAAMTLLLVLFGISGVWADEVSAEQALEQALTFLAEQESTSGGARRAQGVTPQLTLASKVSGLYVFNVENDGGFVVVSNDDRIRPILGFGESGSFNPENIPDNMRAWLQGYADEIAWLAEHGSKATGPQKARQKIGSHSTTAITPLVKTTWNQGTPYNNQCPKYDDFNRSATGCVATAMAQVMKYHEWPTSSKKTIPAYTTGTYGLSMSSLAVTTFDWANMKNSYSSGSYTTTQSNAVATLMKYCGCSLKMDYGPESGAFTNDVASALKTYFDYKSTTKYVTRSSYTYANWTDLIYHELSQARPVVYGGMSSGGGHEFVCDGYKYQSNTDFFHINWGWGGLSDNYFVLSALDPDQQGIGGSTSTDGFHYGQDAVIGIQKPTDTGTTADIEPSYVNLQMNSMSVSNTTVNVNTLVNVTINITNYSFDDYDGDIYIGLKEGDEYYPIEGNNVSIPAGETRDCIVPFTPTWEGTYELVFFVPSSDGYLYTSGVVGVTLNVVSLTTNNYVPIYGKKCDELSRSQFVIPAANIKDMLNSDIKAMTFYASQSSVSWGSAQFDVYLSEISENTISSLKDWSTMKKVYAGNLSISGGQMIITFDNSYKYQGGNLLVGINQTVTGSYSTSAWYGESVSGASVGGYNTSINQKNFRPLVTFDYGASVTPTIEAPKDIVVTPAVTSAIISWTGTGDTYNLRYGAITAEGSVVFSDDFESGMSQWTIYTQGESSSAIGWYAINPTSGLEFEAHSVSNCASSWSWNSSAIDADNWLVTPRVALGGKLKFWVRTNAGYPDSYEVLLSTTGNAIADFTTTLQAKAPAPNNNEWNEVVIDLSAFAGQEGYIAIHHQDYDMNYLLIDDVTIIGPGETSTWTTVYDATSPYTIGGLSGNTSYQVQVQAVYSNGKSDWTVTTFKTLDGNPVPTNIVADLAADGATITWNGDGESYNVRYRTAETAGETIFEDDFESGLDQWTVVTAGEGAGWIIENGAATAYSYENATYTSYNVNNWLISPAVELGGVLKFSVGTASAYPDSYEVLLSTTGKKTTDFTVTLKAMATAVSGNVSIDLSAYAGQTGYIAIHHVCEDCFILTIDNFGVYNIIPAGAWQNMAVNEATATISGLATNNLYEYQIQSVKGDNTSEWSDVEEFALLTLANNADNTSLINIFNGKLAHVTLANRTFYKDNSWNTIYLPFDLTPDEVAASPLAGGDIRTLTNDITVSGETVTLNFTAEGEAFTAFGGNQYYGGVAYIVKWTSGSDIVNPAFANVTINNDQYYVGDDTKVMFLGTYAPMSFTDEDKSILFVGAENKLYWPLAGATIGAFRGYFELVGITAGVKQFVLDFGDDDVTGIRSIDNEQLTIDNEDWYDLSGRKLASKPDMKGIYVTGGRKVTIK